jgi:protein-serine/threonine kinase
LQVRLTPDSLQLVLQHCSGGTLESYCKHHRVSEDLACFFMHQLVAVLEHLHSSKIAYRDMKLQNVLLRSKPSRSSPPRLVLCDLGTAKAWTGQQIRCETFVGTPGGHNGWP